MNRIMAFIALACMLINSGCIESTTVLELQPDGSGRIIETTYMSAAAMGMMEGMVGGMMEGMTGKPAEGNTATPISSKPDEASAKRKASMMGEQVSLLSLREVAKPDGAKGTQTIYQFKDISKLKIPMEQDLSGGMDNMAGMDEAAEEDKDMPQAPDPAFITFGFKKGNLTVNMPPPQAGNEAEPQEAGDPAMDAMAAQMMQGMLPMFKGMRIRMLIKLPSEIRQTNAKHVGSDPKTKQKVFVTLMDMNMDKILEQPDGIKKLMLLSELQDDPAALEKLAGIPGIQMETSKQLNIQF